MTIGSPVIETREDGEFIAHASDRGKSLRHFVVTASLLGKEGILMPTKVGADGNQVFCSS